jgi:GH24 family phage-related lysozyme (muramidase)
MWTVALLVLLLAWLAATEVGAAPASEQQTLDIAVPFIAAKEGKRNAAYIPVPGDVPTICYGSTHDIRLGMTMTDRQCLALLQAEVAAYRLALHRYYLAHTIETLLPPARDAAFTSLGYNIGVDACGRSTAVRRLNSGDVSGACDAITWWNRFGKRVMRGLVDRRADERQLCMMGA